MEGNGWDESSTPACNQNNKTLGPPVGGVPFFPGVRPKL